MSRRIILDCDPGHDDAMAILLAHGTPEIELAALTTVAGKPFTFILVFAPTARIPGFDCAKARSTCCVVCSTDCGCSS